MQMNKICEIFYCYHFPTEFLIFTLCISFLVYILLRTRSLSQSIVGLIKLLITYNDKKYFWCHFDSVFIGFIMVKLI